MLAHAECASGPFAPRTPFEIWFQDKRASARRTASFDNGRDVERGRVSPPPALRKQPPIFLA